MELGFLHVTMTKEDIITLAREVAIRYPLIGTFTVVDGAADFEATNTNKTYQDYLNGHFWSRDWVLQGAPADILRKQYPILGVELKRVMKDSIYSKSACYEMWVLIADQVGCDTCETKKSKEQVDFALLDMALNYVQELVKYGVDDTGFHIVDPGTSCFRDMLFEDTPLDIKSVDLGLADRVRGVSFPLKFCNCVQDQTYRNFDTPKPIALTKCSTC